MNDFVLFGTLFNVIAVVVGSLCGLLVRKIVPKGKGGELGERISDTVFKGLGLCVMLIGIGGAIEGTVNSRIISALSGGGVEISELPTERTLIIIISIALGALVGGLIDLDKRINTLGERLEKLTRGKGGQVAQGFVSASLLFCVGSMAVVGSMNSGILHDHNVLITKSIIDMISAAIFASTMGIGVMFSAVFVFVYQGAITVIAALVGPFLSADVITCMSTTGSLLIIGLGCNMIGATKIKVMNYVPAMFFPIGLIPLWDMIASWF